MPIEAVLARFGMGTSTRQRIPLRRLLIALILIALVPAIGAIGIAVLRVGEAYREASAQQLLTTARFIAHTLERELTANAAIVSVLASPIRNDTGQTPGLGRLADIETYFGSAPTLIPQPDETVSIPVVPAAQAAVEAARSQGRWAISNLFTVENQSLRLAVAVPSPAASNGENEVLLLNLAPERIIRALDYNQTHVEDRRLIAITDGNGRILARSLDNKRMIGQRAPDWDVLQQLDSASGVFPATTFEGERIIFGFEHVPSTPGWTVVVGESQAVFDARWQRPLVWLTVGSSVAILIALGLAVLTARLILRSVRALASRAQRIADGSSGDDVDIDTASPIAELEMLRERLAHSETALQDRAAAERRSAEEAMMGERRYRALAEAGALVIWRREISGKVVAATGWQDLTGEPDDDALGDKWRKRVHPDDHPSIEAIWSAGKAQLQPIDAEFRILAHDGQWRWVRGRGAPVFLPSGEPIEWAGVLEDIDGRRREQDRVAYLAMHDSLTELLNRNAFREQLDRAIAMAGRGHPGRLLYLDLDGFKQVNDRYGHAFGDALLCAVATRLKSIVRKTDVLARIGGDEFTVIESGSDNDAVRDDLPNRIIRALSESFEIEGERIFIGVSIGMVRISHGEHDADQLVRQADVALYSAKASGRGRCVSFDDDIDTHPGAFTHPS